jgi:hypothetical protein
MSFVTGFRARETNAALNRSADAKAEIQKIRELRSAHYAKLELERQYSEALDVVAGVRAQLEAEENQPSAQDQLDDAIKVAVALERKIGLKAGSNEPDFGSKRKKDAA